MALLEKDLPGAAAVDQPVDRRYRLSTEQYYKMGEAGIFGDDVKRVELIDGEIIKLAPIGPFHSRRGRSLFLVLESLLRGDFFVIYEESITIVDGTEPQPDLAIAKGPELRYDNRHPRFDDLVVVVEISESSLARDRKRKLPLYASAGIPEFWIVNLVDKQVEVYSKPEGATYASTAIYKAGDDLPLSFAPGKSLAVAQFVP